MPSWLTGDVFLLQTKDKRNPLIYAIFSTSRLSPLLTALPMPGSVTLVLHITPSLPPALFSRVQLFVSIPWLTFAEPSWAPSHTRRAPTISGCHTRVVCHTLVQAWYVPQRCPS